MITFYKIVSKASILVLLFIAVSPDLLKAQSLYPAFAKKGRYQGLNIPGLYSIDLLNGFKPDEGSEFKEYLKQKVSPNEPGKDNAPYKKKDKDMYDGPELMAELEILKTKDPATGKVPRERLIKALDQTSASRKNTSKSPLTMLSWTERGPDSDAIGPSNGNTRPNNDVTSGRIRAIMVDAADATKKTVWIGGVDGGLWKTTDITVSPANWMVVNDYLSNLAVAAICQDPTDLDIMYFCTGESYYNFDAVQGVGVFKSTDHGVTWNFLPSTAGYINGTRILCDYEGNIYLATRGNGVLRSTKASGGAAWTLISPAAPNLDICDMEISSTSGPGRLHVVTGIFSTQSYYYTDTPASATPSSGWNSPATAFPSYTMRAEIAVSGNILYAAPANDSWEVPTMYKSTDGGANWAATAAQPTSGWANGQAWYDLSVVINPADPNQCIIGTIDNFKTTDGGSSWTKISSWYGTTGQYVHADQHHALWWDGGAKLMFASDGGIFYSSDGATTIRDRNIGLRLKQFYSVAIHPTATDYFLAGAQDNGNHQLTNPGMGGSVEVTGGDGAFVAIDQDQPQYQFAAYVRNQYRRSVDGGATWVRVNFSSSNGRFINPFDYDNTANVMYCAYSGGNYLRWTNPQTGSTNATVAITALGGSRVTAVYASPNTANRVYLGTDNYLAATQVCYVDNANTTASGSAGNAINTGLPTNAYTSSIVAGTDDQNLMVCFSNYGIQNVWVSTNGGISWTAIDGNLPDMPVRWGLFYPGDNTRAYIATETGVWETSLIDGSSTVWNANSSFPTVRTDMIKYRPSDRTIAAATHGRGIFTTSIPCQPVSVTNPANTTGTAGTAFSETFTSAGGIGTVTFTTSSTLPAGLTLSSGGVLNGTPAQSGTFTITVTATDGYSCSGSGSLYTLLISCPVITVTNPSTSTGMVDTPFSQTFTSTGGTATITYTTSSTLPTGLTLAANGTLSGTPTLSGTFTVTVTASDGYSCSGSGSLFTLVIGCPPMTVEGLSNQTRTGDGIVTFTVTNGAGLTVQWSGDGSSPNGWEGGTNTPTVTVAGPPVKVYARLYNATTLCTSPWSLDYYGTAYSATAPPVFGSTRYGQSSGGGSDFVDKNGRLSDIPMLSNYGQDLSNVSTDPLALTVTLSSASSTSATAGTAFSRITVSSTPVMARGVCWSTTTSPVISGAHTVDGSGVVDYTSIISGLTTGTKYYVRAWAINSSGLHYSNEMDFTTP